MGRPTPKILTGGQKLKIAEVNRHFISAYVTDTRLMGVLAVYAHWHLDTVDEEPGKGNAGAEIPGAAAPGRDSSPSNGAHGDTGSDPVTWGDLHQFFYIDCEETGLETYYGIRVSDPEKVEEREQALIGGLGAARIDLSEPELRRLMCRYRDFNLQRGLPLPEGLDDYGFLFTPDMAPDETQRRELMARICPKITSVHQLINYFMMRCFGRDHEGARFLSLDDTVPVDLYDRYVRATFCRNVIDWREPARGGKESPRPDTREYLCESLVETEGRYEVIISRVWVRKRKIAGLEYCSGFPVSTTEAALMLRKTEYVNVYEIMLSEEELEENMGEFSVGFHATLTNCKNGRLFMAYRPNNDHVNRREFQLNNDVAGVYFLSEGGQLITAAYSVEDANDLTMTLKKSVLAPYLLPHGKYKFIEPVLYEFMHGDIERFETFLRILSGEE